MVIIPDLGNVAACVCACAYTWRCVTVAGKQFPTAVVVSATEGMTDELINVTRVAHQQGGLPTALALLNAAVDRQVAIIHSLLGTATPTQAGAAGNAPAEDRAASAMGTEKRAELIDAVVASIHRDRDNVAGGCEGCDTQSCMVSEARMRQSCAHHSRVYM